MKKVILIIAAVLMLICANSCTKTVESFGVNPTSLTIRVGETGQYKIMQGDIDPEHGDLDAYVSEGKQYAEVHGMYVTGIAPGKAVVVVTYTPDGASKPSHSASLQVTVTN